MSVSRLLNQGWREAWGCARQLGVCWSGFGLVITGTAGAGSWPAGASRRFPPASPGYGEGDLSAGQASSSIRKSKQRGVLACHGECQLHGNPCFFGTQIPRQSEMRISVIPDIRRSTLVCMPRGRFERFSEDPSRICRVRPVARRLRRQERFESWRDRVRQARCTTNPYNVLSRGRCNGVKSGGFTSRSG